MLAGVQRSTTLTRVIGVVSAVALTIVAASAPASAGSDGDSSQAKRLDDVRLCAPLEGSEAVLELSFPATVVADVVLGSVTPRGRLDLFVSPETSFDVLFDLLIEEGGSVPTVYAHHQEADMNLAMQQPWC